MSTRLKLFAKIDHAAEELNKMVDEADREILEVTEWLLSHRTGIPSEIRITDREQKSQVIAFLRHHGRFCIGIYIDGEFHAAASCGRENKIIIQKHLDELLEAIAINLTAFKSKIQS